MHAHGVAHVLQHQAGHAALRTLDDAEQVVDHRVDLGGRRRIGQQLDRRVNQAHRGDQMAGTVAGAVEGADAALGVAGVDGQPAFESLVALLARARRPRSRA